ncbi:MAG: DNA repair protein RadC [Candidatus Eisenbacteria bacterium]
MRDAGGLDVGGVPPVEPSDLELLCVLLSGGTGRSPAAEVGAALLARFGSLGGVLREPPSSLTRVRGVGRRAAARIRAARELGRRFWNREVVKPRLYVSGPGDVADLFMREMGTLDREHFRAVLLDTKNRILGVRTISIGSLNSSVVHAREVFKAAVYESAQAIVLIHNHPSGLPDPSSEDLAVTRRLAEAGRILGIEILDHVIVGARGFVSLRELGHM